MTAKIKITRNDILEASFSLLRREGLQAVNARNIANALSCSTQPIFSNFDSMKELHIALINKANSLFEEFLKNEYNRDQYPPYKAYGMAYIRFAKEEKALFKLLYMRNRSDDLQAVELAINTQMETVVMENTNLDHEVAKLFHLEMWAFVHGIATMFATDYIDLDWEIVSKMLTDVYQGLRKRYNLE